MSNDNNFCYSAQQFTLAYVHFAEVFYIMQHQNMSSSCLRVYRLHFLHLFQPHNLTRSFFFFLLMRQAAGLKLQDSSGAVCSISRQGPCQLQLLLLLKRNWLFNVTERHRLCWNPSAVEHTTICRCVFRCTHGRCVCVCIQMFSQERSLESH